MPSGYTLVDPFSKETKFTRAGLGFPEYQKAYLGLLNSFQTQNKVTIFCVHRLKGIGRWFNVHPNNPGGEHICMALIDGHWRMGTEEEEKAYYDKVVAEKKAEEKRRISAFAQAANIQAATLVKENKTLQTALAADEEEESKQLVMAGKDDAKHKKEK